jgi:hypothetical protein
MASGDEDQEQSQEDDAPDFRLRNALSSIGGGLSSFGTAAGKYIRGQQLSAPTPSDATSTPGSPDFKQTSVESTEGGDLSGGAPPEEPAAQPANHQLSPEEQAFIRNGGKGPAAPGIPGPNGAVPTVPSVTPGPGPKAENIELYGKKTELENQQAAREEADRALQAKAQKDSDDQKFIRQETEKSFQDQQFYNRKYMEEMAKDPQAAYGDNSVLGKILFAVGGVFAGARGLLALNPVGAIHNYINDQLQTAVQKQARVAASMKFGEEAAGNAVQYWRNRGLDQQSAQEHALTALKDLAANHLEQAGSKLDPTTGLAPKYMQEAVALRRENHGKMLENAAKVASTAKTMRDEQKTRQDMQKQALEIQNRGATTNADMVARKWGINHPGVPMPDWLTTAKLSPETRDRISSAGYMLSSPDAKKAVDKVIPANRQVADAYDQAIRELNDPNSTAQTRETATANLQKTLQIAADFKRTSGVGGGGAVEAAMQPDPIFTELSGNKGIFKQAVIPDRIVGGLKKAKELYIRGANRELTGYGHPGQFKEKPASFQAGNVQ